MRRFCTVLGLGGALWGLWVLLWREPRWPIVLGGGVFPLGLWLLGRAGRVALTVPRGFLRVDLWFRFLALVGLRVAVAVAQTSGAVLAGTVQPGVVRVPLRVRSELAQLLLLWAITVTPGTIALLAEGDVLHVHCLHLPTGADLPGLGRLQDLLERIWG